MSLKDLKTASASRQQDQAPTTPSKTKQPSKPVNPPIQSDPPVQTPSQVPAVTDGRTKMLGGRVPLAVHREFQQHLFRAQEHYPDLTTQDALPIMIRLLRDETVWQKFMAELSLG